MRRTGLEPAHLAAPAPQAGVSTNSTTAAYNLISLLENIKKVNPLSSIYQGLSMKIILERLAGLSKLTDTN